MRQYRVFSFDSADHIVRAPTIIEAETDEEAIEAASNLGDGVMEIWLLHRLVYRFEARRREA